MLKYSNKFIHLFLFCEKLSNIMRRSIKLMRSQVLFNRALSTGLPGSTIKIPCLHGWTERENTTYVYLRYPAVLKPGKIIKYTKRVGDVVSKGDVVARVNVVPSRYVDQTDMTTVELLASQIDKPMKVMNRRASNFEKRKVEPGVWIMDLEPIY